MSIIASRGLPAAERRQISRRAAQGHLRELYSGIYTDDLTSPLEVEVRRNLFAICAIVAPGAVISHRSALKSEASDTYYLTGPYRRNIEIGGVSLKIDQGFGPQPEDLRIPTEFGNAFRSSEARAFLEVLARGRSVAGEKRTLDVGEVEDLLERRFSAVGEKGFNALRDQARASAAVLGLESSFDQLNRIMGAIQGTRDHALISVTAKARASGSPVDVPRLELFQNLKEQLEATAIPTKELSPDTDLDLQAFIESYFSNFIEGTEFELDEAHEIIVQGKPLVYREDDSHDILGTTDAVTMSHRHPTFPRTFEAFEDQLREWNRKVIFSRAQLNPGQFKEKPNRAGETVFVLPEYVRGTLRSGYNLMMSVPPGSARAALALFVVSEVHPFADGNGRTARLAMNLALTEAGMTRIIIPTVFRDDYLTALRALTRGRDAYPIVKMLSRATAFSSWLDLSSYERCKRDLEFSKAMNDEGVLRFGETNGTEDLKPHS